MKDPTLEPGQRYLLKTTPAGDLMVVMPRTPANESLIGEMVLRVEAKP